MSTSAPIELIELLELRVPMKAPISAAHGTIVARDIVVVRAVAQDGGEGWGECSALPEPTYTGEYTAGAFAVLRDHLLPRLFSGQDPARVRGHPMALAALRTALLDLELRSSGTSLAQHVGAVAARVPAGATVGRAASIDNLVQEIEAVLALGYTRVKMKIEPGWDVEPVRVVSELVGDRADIVVDANGSYTLDDHDVSALQLLYASNVAFLEQPLAPDRLLDHAELCRRIGTAVALDETITSDGVARDAIAVGACRAISVKPGRLGGIDSARAVIASCARGGIDAWIGGMYDTGLGRAVAVTLAATRGITQIGDLSGSTRYFEHDLTETFEVIDGHLRVPDGPGLGVVPDLATSGVRIVRKHTGRR